MTSGILTGEAHGVTRADLLTTATYIAASYFDVGTDRIRVELSNERTEEVTYTRGGERVSIRFAADFLPHNTSELLVRHRG